MIKGALYSWNWFWILTILKCFITILFLFFVFCFFFLNKSGFLKNTFQFDMYMSHMAEQNFSSLVLENKKKYCDFTKTNTD